DLEFIPRPKSFNSKLFYQQYEDPIDYPLISMIQRGFAEINDRIKNNEKNIEDETLLYSSILGLIYTTGLRPVQLAKLSASDIRVDTTHEHDQFHRYSILIPYAKQIRYAYDKIAVKFPEEIAEIILAYVKRFNLQPKDKLFNLGENSARFCSIAINNQLFQFSPKLYQNAVLSGELLQEKYSFSDFRHHVGYSLAMAGASAEEISYILGHSVLVTARHYIYSTPALAQIRANALGKNQLYKQMIAMLLTGRLIDKNKWQHKKVLGNIGGKIHYDIGGCSYEEKCLFQPVRNCYGCMYFHPFIDADHADVLKSIQNEINDLIRLSDGIGVSRNPLIRVHESTKFEIESVIARCEVFKQGGINEN
ncbi:site-specific integrase, partial [Acinetobacter sp. TUM15071]|uniref:site-specific integrase n=1 Tax=Acinetobacter sp. TUM15071 TaxID=2609135 RepID=UPI00124E5323